MSTTRDGSNPLRPYYRPPSIGRPQDLPPVTSSGLGPKNGSAAYYASSARDMFSDVDYSDYFSDASPSTVESVQNMLNDCLHKYFSILLSQPFDVAKTVLQVQSQGPTEEAAKTTGTRSPLSNQRNGSFSNEYDELYHGGSDSDPDEPAYFTSSALSPNPYNSTRSRRGRSDRSLSPASSPASPKETSPSHQLILKGRDSLLEVIGQEWSKEGAWGVWKGSNATFVYSFLLKTLESWSRGVLSALLNVPDPGTVAGLGAATDLMDTSYPWSSLGVAVAAAVAAGLILAPLDLVRTKHILTPTSEPKRSLSQNLRALPSYLCPAPLMTPTALHSLIDPTISHATPILLRSRLGIDPVLTPATYSLCKFMSRTAELFLKLPLETVLRRGQMFVLASPAYSGEQPLRTTVEIGPYRGVIGTMWSIMREEGPPSQELLGDAGVRTGATRKRAGKRGQGVEGLWRGWRVGMWGLVGVWGASVLGGNGNSGGEF